MVGLELVRDAMVRYQTLVVLDVYLHALDFFSSKAWKCGGVYENL